MKDRATRYSDNVYCRKIDRFRRALKLYSFRFSKLYKSASTFKCGYMCIYMYVYLEQESNIMLSHSHFPFYFFTREHNDKYLRNLATRHACTCPSIWLLGQLLMPDDMPRYRPGELFHPYIIPMLLGYQTAALRRFLFMTKSLTILGRTALSIVCLKATKATLNYPRTRLIIDRVAPWRHDLLEYLTWRKHQFHNKSYFET